jgi:hypothetical protein
MDLLYQVNQKHINESIMRGFGDWLLNKFNIVI